MVVGGNKTNAGRRKKGTLRGLISLWSELQWKTANNRSFFVEKTVKTLQEKKIGMLICLRSLLLQLQFFPLKHRYSHTFSVRFLHRHKAPGSQNVSLVRRSVDRQLEGVAGHVGVGPVPKQQLHAVHVPRPGRVVQDGVAVGGLGLHVAAWWKTARLQRAVRLAFGLNSRGFGVHRAGRARPGPRCCPVRQRSPEESPRERLWN